MAIRQEVIDQLLLAKWMLDRIRTQAPPNPDRYTLATNILTAHDAAEIALAAIAAHVGKMPGPNEQFLMKYLDKIKELHPSHDVVGRAFMGQLNRARTDVKHFGLNPDPNTWARVAENVYNDIAEWCDKYLSISFNDLDESTRLVSTTVKQWYDQARAAMSEDKYREVLESLAQAMFYLFRENLGLRRLSVGRADATEAIKLTGFGVHANDYLALQEFLPQVQAVQDGSLKVTWQQSEYGHPGNWDTFSAKFCLKTFLDVALKIQEVPWIPTAIPFSMLYEEKVVALRDGVEIWIPQPGTDPRSGNVHDRKVVKRLGLGESIVGSISSLTMTLVDVVRQIPNEKLLSIFSEPKLGRFIGYVAASDVKEMWVPREDDWVRRNFPNLRELPWEPDEQ